MAKLDKIYLIAEGTNDLKKGVFVNKKYNSIYEAKKDAKYLAKNSKKPIYVGEFDKKNKVFTVISVD